MFLLLAYLVPSSNSDLEKVKYKKTPPTPEFGLAMVAEAGGSLESKASLGYIVRQTKQNSEMCV